MSRAVPVASAVIALFAIVSGFVTEQVANLGGVRCQVYCGPGAQTLPFGWMVATAILWLTGLAFAVVGLARSRARSGGAWLGVALSCVLPLIFAYLATHPAAG